MTGAETETMAANRTKIRVNLIHPPFAHSRRSLVFMTLMAFMSFMNFMF